MAPFIKYTDSIATASGTRSRLVFINAANIIKATYDQQEGTLLITCNPNEANAIIKGDEASAALAVLQSL